ncbi:unnamed protein product [Caenorhabditis nigoni]
MSFERSVRDLVRTITFDAYERGREDYKTEVVARQVSVAPELAAHLRTIRIVQTTTEMLDHKDATLRTLQDVSSRIMEPVDVTPSNARQDNTRKDIDAEQYYKRPVDAEDVVNQFVSANWTNG